MALPPVITSRFQIDTVREAGQETGSSPMDLLLTVETIDDTTEYVYVLVEHKSYPAPLVAVQLLGYVAGVMKKHGNAPVPVIHPVVFYHGKKKWTAPTVSATVIKFRNSAE
jgi:predicted transposase YdaD